jgi:hypothetical protein
MLREQMLCRKCIPNSTKCICSFLYARAAWSGAMTSRGTDISAAFVCVRIPPLTPPIDSEGIKSWVLFSPSRLTPSRTRFDCECDQLILNFPRQGSLVFRSPTRFHLLPADLRLHSVELGFILWFLHSDQYVALQLLSSLWMPQVFIIWNAANTHRCRSRSNVRINFFATTVVAALLRLVNDSSSVLSVVSCLVDMLPLYQYSYCQWSFLCWKCSVAAARQRFLVGFFRCILSCGHVATVSILWLSVKFSLLEMQRSKGMNGYLFHNKDGHQYECCFSIYISLECSWIQRAITFPN